MRDHYVGDVTDFIKFSLLRHLAIPSRVLGLAWYYIPGCDNEKDGTHTEWKRNGDLINFDPVTHKWLKERSELGRSVALLEDISFWKVAAFHRVAVPSGKNRSEWVLEMKAKLAKADLIFLDPDNGIKDGSRKHATLSEIRELGAAERTIICIVFPHRNTKHVVQAELLRASLGDISIRGSVAILKTTVSVPNKTKLKYVSPRQRWFAIINASQADLQKIENFAKRLDAIIGIRTSLES